MIDKNRGPEGEDREKIVREALLGKLKGSYDPYLFNFNKINKGRFLANIDPVDRANIVSEFNQIFANLQVALGFYDTGPAAETKEKNQAVVEVTLDDLKNLRLHILRFQPRLSAYLALDEILPTKVKEEDNGEAQRRV